ncbi:nucleotidyltransferase [Croceicoccus ponticola]|uniref:Cyclic GMP-AMP synthase n=1 Tax=Croceicoccus ponticola TaxID=2217664 RepID=A0A437GU14_9SPHN|nr:nucleotidyltransferase [Croceicoccus ponticola]RVQ64633.1 nucleotidyltransferase [Croceicoccus ponticola]
MIHGDILRQFYDDLLGDVARKIQISRTAYEEAVRHFNVVSAFIHEETSGLSHLDPVIYPQGSFRMASTISAYDDREDYDIDLLLELDINRFAAPEAVLETIASALRKAQGRLKFKSLEVKKRCVTLWYENMHLDITPAVLIPGRQARVIGIFDTHPDRPDHALANPEGFAIWFDDMVRPGVVMDSIKVRASTVPVPQQKPAELKTTRLLTVQLLKRFRDIRCDARDYDRMPSVLLSKIAAEAPPGRGLLANLRSAAQYMAPIVGRPLHVENPACREDLLSDRWPKKAVSQRMLAEDLNHLVTKLDDLLAEGTQLEKKQIIRDLFGENAAAEGYRLAAERAAAKSREGAFGIAAGGGAAGAGTSAKSTVAPKHRFYGDPE